MISLKTRGTKFTVIGTNVAHLSMDCFWASVKAGELELKEAEAAKWLSKEELDELEWLPADWELIRGLRG